MLPRAPVRTLPSMSEPLISLDTSLIRDGRLDELKEAVTELVEFVRSNEPRPIAYEVYFDEAGSRMTVLQVHPDSASMEYHMTVAGPAFAGFAELVTLSTLDVYGKPSEELLELLRRKVQMLGDTTVIVHDLQAGFARI
jgi:quinol monooxygenase YgiN